MSFQLAHTEQKVVMLVEQYWDWYRLRTFCRRAHSNTSYLFVDLNLLSLNSLSPRFPKGRHLVCRIPSSSTRLLPSNPSPCGSLDSLWPAPGTPHHSSLFDFVDIVDKRISNVCTLHRGRGERNHAQDCIQVSYDRYQYSRAVTHGVGL
jgi:hypothetical protein